MRIQRLGAGRLAVAVMAAGAAGVAWGQPSGDTTYRALRAARPDGRVLEVRQPLTLERDAFRFHFASGTFHFLTPVDERTVGAVFLGDGRFELHPATEDERRHLAFLGGKADLETLVDRFETLVLLFADDTAEELALHAPLEARAADAAAASAYETFLARQRKDFRVNFYLRLLEDLLNVPGLKSGVFVAYLDGRELPPAVAAVDPRGAEALRLAPLLGAEDSLFYVADDVRGGLWYLCDRAGEVRSGRVPPPYRPLADALHYAIDTEIRRNEEIAGTAVVRLRAEAPLRVLPFYLLPSLRIEEAAVRADGDDAWVPVPFVQEDRREDAEPAVVLAERLPKGAVLELRLRYSGKEVLRDLGYEVFAVGARESWYPNLGVFTDVATFDLTFRVPAGNQVVAVGTRVADTIEGSQRVSVWRAEQPIRVAGFNYGRFKQLGRRDEISGLDIAVYSHEKAVEMFGRGTASEIADAVVNPDELVEFGGIAPGESAGRRDPGKLSESVAVDAVNAARLFHTYFGPLAQDHVAITQQAQFFFGQSWPSLVFLPYASFMTGTARKTIGLAGRGMDAFVEQVGFHEMAHQWWGHHVGWQSYRDQWLSEGFAELSSALAVQHVMGWDAYAKFWRDARDRIVSKTASTVPIYQVGPITRGYRLSSSRSPAAYSILVYSKGGFVLHMLRMMMWDPSSPQPDARFIAMMRDFTSSHAGKSPSTADFQRVVERHVVPEMNATADGKLDWFFDQWVRGTAVPRLEAPLQARRADGDQYRITGHVRLHDVPEDFRALVPLYAGFGKGRVAVIGRLPLLGTASRPVDVTLKLPEKPRRIVANLRHEVLARE